MLMQTLKEDYMELKEVNPSRISWGTITKNENDYSKHLMGWGQTKQLTLCQQFLTLLSKVHVWRYPHQGEGIWRRESNAWGLCLKGAYKGSTG